MRETETSLINHHGDNQNNDESDGALTIEEEEVEKDDDDDDEKIKFETSSLKLTEQNLKRVQNNNIR